MRKIAKRIVVQFPAFVALSFVFDFAFVLYFILLGSALRNLISITVFNIRVTAEGVVPFIYCITIMVWSIYVLRKMQNCRDVNVKEICNG